MLSALMFALIGGIILNLMPCVLPVLSIKALSITKMGKLSKSHAIKAGLAYGAGVSLCMFLFSSILIILRNMGFSIGWGYQMQSPTFVSLMIYLVFILGLSMSGLFEFPSLNPKKPTSYHSLIHENFFTGLYCVLLATPCFAPFMGSAISFALLQDNTFYSIAIFQGLAVGLSLPYIMISISPGFTKILPKPGKWMNTLKIFLAFPMYATSAWLIWVLTKISGANSVLVILIGIILATFSFVFWNAFIKDKDRLLPIHRLSTASVLVLLSLSPIAKISLLEFQNSGNLSSIEQNKDVLFSMDKINELKLANKSFIVVVGADWCITCKINERLLDSNDTRNMLQKYDIIRINADWTNMDQEITKYMRTFNSVGVPLYVAYIKGQQPTKLPQILTRKILEDTFKNNTQLKPN